MSKHYNIQKHIQRLYWRLGNGSFTPNQNDVEAVDNLTDFINDCISQELDQNKPYQKLYIHLLGIYFNHYKNIHTAQSKVHEVLGLHIDYQYQKFTDDFNQVELEQFLESIGIEAGKHPMEFTDEKQAENLEAVKENKDKWLKFLQGKWDYKKVKQSLNTQLVSAYNQFKSED